MSYDYDDEICNELRSSGLMDVSSVNEILKMRIVFCKQNDWDKFTDIMIKYIEKSEDINDKEFLIRIIGDKYCLRAVDYLIELFKKPEYELIRWAIGNSLSLILVPAEKYGVISELILDKKYGTARQMLLYLFIKGKEFADLDVVRRSLEDSDITAHAIYVLGRVGTKEDINLIEPYLNSDRKLVKKEAKIAIERISKRERKKKNK